MNISSILAGAAAFYYSVKNSKTVTKKMDDLKLELNSKIDNQDVYVQTAIEEATKKYDVTEYVKCTSVRISLRSITDKFWSARFYVTFHNSDIIPIKITGIRCQPYINGVGLTRFTAGTGSTFTINPKSDYTIQLSGEAHFIFVNTKNDRDKIRDAFDKKGSTIGANANVGYVLLASASDIENHQSDNIVMGTAKYYGGGRYENGINYGTW